MITHTTITNLTQDDLVNLLSTAFYDNPHFAVAYDKESAPFYKKDDEDCFEDIMAKILLNGGRILVRDLNAEDGEVMGNLPCRVAKSEDYEDVWTTTYYVTLASIEYGLMRACNGTFNAGENDKYSPTWREDNIRSAQVSFYSYAYDDTKWDAVRADILMQIILFDEIVYG